MYRVRSRMSWFLQMLLNWKYQWFFTSVFFVRHIIWVWKVHIYQLEKSREIRHADRCIIIFWQMVDTGSMHRPYEIWTKIKVIDSQAIFCDWRPTYILWNCPQMNVRGRYWLSVSTGLGNGLVPLGNKPLFEPILTNIYVAIWHPLTAIIKWMINTNINWVWP